VTEGAHVALAASDRRKATVISMGIILELYARLLSAAGLLLFINQCWLTPVKPVALQVHVGAVVVKKGYLKVIKEASRQLSRLLGLILTSGSAVVAIRGPLPVSWACNIHILGIRSACRYIGTSIQAPAVPGPAASDWCLDSSTAVAVAGIGDHQQAGRPGQTEQKCSVEP